MTKKRLLIGSLSSDLYRVATLTQRGSLMSAERFLKESDKWTKELKNITLKAYIKKIILDLDQNAQTDKLTLETAEKYLMYSVLLQNYALHIR